MAAVFIADKNCLFSCSSRVPPPLAWPWALGRVRSEQSFTTVQTPRIVDVCKGLGTYTSADACEAQKWRFGNSYRSGGGDRTVD